MHLRMSSRVWISAVACLVVAQAGASMYLPKSYGLTAITDWISLVLMISAAAAFGRNASTTDARQRLVWILLGGGYALEACGQILWMRWELVLQQTPSMYLGDAFVFLAWTALILGFALRPHAELTPQHQCLGTIDLLFFFLTGIYLYSFLVIPWQYLAPETQSYGAAYKFLALAQDVILLTIVILGWKHSSGRWRTFYVLLTGIVALDTVMEYVQDTVADAGIYFSGSWYDSTTAACLAGMTLAALLTYRLEPVSEQSDLESERYWRWASRLASPAALIVPLLAAVSFLDRSLPNSVLTFRVLLSLAAVGVFGLVSIMKHHRLESALAQVNRELLEASLTDPVTGTRNRRFFTHSIENDVQRVLRSFASGECPDVRNRDIVFYMIDIDHFKQVNDRFGHKVGDQVLAEVARRIQSAARLSDAVIRWGGEEFLLLSRYTDRKDAQVLAGRVLDSMGSEPYSVKDGKESLRITCSMGWAAFPWQEREPKLVPHEQVLQLADAALYQAKGSGRNRAVGVMPAGQILGDCAATTAHVNGILASSVITLGPPSEKNCTPAAKYPRIAAASSTN